MAVLPEFREYIRCAASIEYAAIRFAEIEANIVATISTSASQPGAPFSADIVQCLWLPFVES